MRCGIFPPFSAAKIAFTEATNCNQREGFRVFLALNEMVCPVEYILIVSNISIYTRNKCPS